MDFLRKAWKDRRVAAEIQELRKKAARSCRLGVDTTVSRIRILLYIPGEERHPKYITFNAQQNEPQHEQMMTAIGEVLAQNNSQLQRFRLSWLNSWNNVYPQFWRGLAANRVLKEVYFHRIIFPNEPNVARFLTNPALESLDMLNCNFSHGKFCSFCQGIQSSHIKKLRISCLRLPQEASWSLLWSALEHGATCLERFRVGVSSDATHGAENGFESFLANNTTIKSIHLYNIIRGRDDLPFLVALGRGLAVNTIIQIVNIRFPTFPGNLAIGKQLIQTVFSEGLDHNMMVNSLTVEMHACLEAVNALADGLERMMRNRANAATHDGRDEEESLPVLQELAVHFNVSSHDLRATTDTAHALFFDRLSRSDVIRVEKVKVTHSHIEQMLPPKMYDFIRSTRVTKSLVYVSSSGSPNDKRLASLADAIEANHSISEVQVEYDAFHKMTNLWPSPNKYRIRCQCRRNEIQVQTFRKAENLSLLPLVLARLLLLDDRPADYRERRKIEASQLVDRTIAFEMLKDIPALFAIYGK